LRPPPVGGNEFDGVVAFGGLGGGGVLFRPGVNMRFDMHGNPLPLDGLPNPRVVGVPLKLATPTARSIRRLEGFVLGEIQLTNQTLVAVPDLSKNTGVAFTGP